MNDDERREKPTNERVIIASRRRCMLTSAVSAPDTRTPNTTRAHIVHSKKIGLDHTRCVYAVPNSCAFNILCLNNAGMFLRSDCSRLKER